MRKGTSSVSRKTRPSEAGRGRSLPEPLAPGIRGVGFTLGEESETESREGSPDSRALPATARGAKPGAAPSWTPGLLTLFTKNEI